MSRKLASVCVVEEILPIEGADRIELARVRGWWVVVGKGEFNVGDFGVYFEIDSLMPLDNPAFAFLANPDKPTQTHVKLKTRKYRNQISQGLLVPIGKFENLGAYDEGTDLSDVLGIEKWEPQIPAQLQGLVKGTRPWFIPKTDEERVQNFKPSLLYGSFEVTEKLDGSSMSVYFKDGEFGICSRNMNLSETEGNTFWKVAREYNLEDALRYAGRQIVLQGELVGEGIQKNRLKLTGHHFFIYNIYLIDEARYMTPEERHSFIQGFSGHAGSATQTPVCIVKSVPVVDSNFTLSEDSVPFTEVHKYLLDLATGPSAFGAKYREGLVFKRHECYGTTREVYSFKVISNEYLLKHSE